MDSLRFSEALLHQDLKHGASLKIPQLGYYFLAYFKYTG